MLGSEHDCRERLSTSAHDRHVTLTKRDERDERDGLPAFSYERAASVTRPNGDGAGAGSERLSPGGRGVRLQGRFDPDANDILIQSQSLRGGVP